MAKRVPKDEKPFRPVDEALIKSVMSGSPAPAVPAGLEQGGARVSATVETPEPAQAKVVSMPARQISRIDATEVFDKRSREKRVLLTKREERDIERLVGRVAAEVGTPIKLSHILRGCISLMLHAEEELVERARKATLTRPGNGDAPQLAEFERGLTEVLSNALREARPFR